MVKNIEFLFGGSCGALSERKYSRVASPTQDFGSLRSLFSFFLGKSLSQSLFPSSQPRYTRKISFQKPNVIPSGGLSAKIIIPFILKDVKACAESFNRCAYERMREAILGVKLSIYERL